MGLGFWPRPDGKRVSAVYSTRREVPAHLPLQSDRIEIDRAGPEFESSDIGSSRARRLTDELLNFAFEVELFAARILLVRKTLTFCGRSRGFVQLPVQPLEFRIPVHAFGPE